MGLPKILLLTSGIPRDYGAGEAITAGIAKRYEPGHIYRLCTTAAKPDIKGGSWMGNPYEVFHIPVSRFPVLSSLRDWQFRQFYLRPLLERTLDVIRQEQIDLVWSMLGSASTLYLTGALLDMTPVPVVVSIFDIPEYFAGNMNLDPLTRRRWMETFARILGHSQGVSVISEGMAAYFRERYGMKGNVMVLRHGIPPGQWRQYASNMKYSDKLVISFAGSLYAKEEWNALMKAINKAGKIGGRAIEVHFVGRFPRTRAKAEDYVIKFGLRSFPETMQLLEGGDIAYLPYRFASKWSLVARTSFPTKLSAYLAAGLPVLYHGPEDSSPTEFFGQYPVGVCCHSLDEDEIVAGLEKLALGDVRVRASMARLRALQEELGLEVMLSRFAELIGVDSDELQYSG